MGSGEPPPQPTGRDCRRICDNPRRREHLRQPTYAEPPMSALICGSLAYDTIMVFQDQFKNHILPDKVHVLNVSFLVPRMRREFGGCAGNIAYNLKLLGADPLPMATVGQDFAPYREHFTRCGIDLACVKVLDGPLHRAGVHHDRSRRQPDHRIPSRRDDALVRKSRARRRRRDVRHRRAGRPRSDAAARRGIRRARRSLHLRSRSGDAALLRRRIPRVHRQGATTSPSTITNRCCCSGTPAGRRKRSPIASRRTSSRAGRRVR